MKIFDCFTFFNEIELLEFRLHLLDPCVDHFVIAESNLTHSGLPKPYHFETHKERFNPWLKKIIYIPVAQTTEGLVFEKNLETYNPETAAWKLENGQRNALAAALPKMADGDLVILSDLDEIPDPRLIKKLQPAAEPRSLSMLFHYYYMNCQQEGSERWWNGSIVCSGQQFAQVKPQGLRDRRNDYPVIKKAGWHFSYLGGPGKIRDKISSFAHTEFNREEFTSEENITRAMASGQDIFRRPGFKYRFEPLSFYPLHLRKLMIEYPSFLYLNGKFSPWKNVYYFFRNLFN